MRCLLPLIVVLLLVPTAKGEVPTNAKVIVDEVQVQSGKGKIGPGAFYATAILKRGDRVFVLDSPPENGCYQIQPLPGSYDLIHKDEVTGHTGRVKVKKDNSEIYVGSKFRSPDQNLTMIGTRGLNKKADVEIIGPLEGNYYPITPEYSVRWIPVEAVQLDASVQMPGADDSNGRPGLNAPNFTQPLTGDIGQKVQQAEQFYRSAKATNQPGDWANATQLYQDLARTDNPEVRLMALNRLEFIRMRTQNAYGANQNYVGNAGGYSGANATPASFRPSGSAPRAGSSYIYSQDGGPSRLAPFTQNSPPFTQPPQQPAVPPIVNQPPGNQVRYPPPQNNGAREFGQLYKFQRTEAGRPVYGLLDSQRKVKCYVIPADGVQLDQFINQNVILTGNGPLTYHPELEKYVLLAASAKLMN